MRKMLAALAAVVLATNLAACASDGTAGQSVTLRIGDNWGTSHPVVAAIDKVFKPEVEKLTEGRVKIDAFHSGALGNEADLWANVRTGKTDIVVVGTPMNKEFPQMLISDWLWLYRDVAHAKAVWTSSFADKMTDEFNKKFSETELMAWGPNSARTFTSLKPLTKPADFRGQTIRTPDNPIHEGLIKALGADAQFIPLGELYAALETKAVDGQDNGMATVISQDYYGLQKYIYETNHIIATQEFIINKAALQNLSESDQKVIREAAKKAAAQAWDDYLGSLAKDREFLIGKGLTITEPTAEDRQKMIEATKPVTDKLLHDNPWAVELIAEVSEIK